MITAQVAALFGEIELRLAKWNAGIARVERDIRRLARMPLVLTVTLNQRAINAALGRLQGQIRRIAATPIQLNVTGLTSLRSQMAGLNRQMAAMVRNAKAASAAMQGMQMPRSRWAVPGGPAVAGLGRGLGMPLGLDPRLLAGMAVGGGAAYSAREAIRTESAAASIGGITGLSPGRSAAMAGQLGRIATETPGLRRAEAFGLGGVVARAGVGEAGIPGVVRAGGRLAAMTPDADPVTLVEQTIQTINAYRMDVAENVEGFTNALAALDAASVASAQDILDIARRFAGSGKAAGLSIHQTLALGAVMRSRGVPRESGSTAIQRILGKLADDAQRGQIAGAIGMSPGALEAQYQADPLGAIESITNAIDRARSGGGNALDFIRSRMGFENVRDIQALGQLAGSGEEIRSLTRVSERESRSGEMMAERFGLEAGTTASGLEAMADAIGSLAAALGGGVTGDIRDFASKISALAAWVERLLGMPQTPEQKQADQAASDARTVAAYEAMSPRDMKEYFNRSPQARAEYQAARDRMRQSKAATDAQALGFRRVVNAPGTRAMMAGMGGGLGGLMGNAAAMAGSFPMPAQPGVPLPPGFGQAFGSMAQLLRDNPGMTQAGAFGLYASQASRNVGGMLGERMGIGGLLGGARSLGQGVGGWLGGGMGFQARDPDPTARFAASITDPMSAMSQQQVDILNAEDVGRQQLDKLDQIKGVLDGILAATKDTGVGGAIQAVLGGGVGGF